MDPKLRKKNEKVSDISLDDNCETLTENIKIYLYVIHKNTSVNNVKLGRWKNIK